MPPCISTGKSCDAWALRELRIVRALARGKLAIDELFSDSSFRLFWLGLLRVAS